MMTEVSIVQTEKSAFNQMVISRDWVAPNE